MAFEACIWLILFYEYLNFSTDASRFHSALTIYIPDQLIFAMETNNSTHLTLKFPSARIRDLGPWFAWKWSLKVKRINGKLSGL